MVTENIQKFSDALTTIENGTTEASDITDLEGYSGAKIISSLQRATEIFCDEGRAYLEIGVFRGLTLLSNAKHNPTIACFGIDNFSLFDEKGENLAFIEGQKKRLKIPNATIINHDFEEALVTLHEHIGDKKIGVLFIDGPHDYRSQLMCLLLAVPYLADECAIFVDDANYPHVRQATVDFLKTCPEFTLLAEAYTPKHIANMSKDEKQAAMAGWWDGINIIVRDPKKSIERQYPKEQMKDLYYATHDIFRHEFADKAFDILKFAQKIADKSTEAEAVQGLKRLVEEHRRKNSALYRHQNTYSEKLPTFALHNAIYHRFATDSRKSA